MENVMQLNEMYQVAEVELVYRSRVKVSQRPSAKSSKEVYRLLLHSWDKNRIEFVEQFKVLLLNRASKVLGIYEVSTGGLTGTVADLRLVFAAALKANATGVILAHNHPSQNTKPSREDEVLTEKMKQAGQLLNIRVMDHIIVCCEAYYSFSDEGLL